MWVMRGPVCVGAELANSGQMFFVYQLWMSEAESLFLGGV
jgi:hypothetical protein